jgi:hypothetical protein
MECKVLRFNKTLVPKETLWNRDSVRNSWNDYNDHDDNSNCNNADENSIQLLFIYMLTQQPRANYKVSTSERKKQAHTKYKTMRFITSE